MADDSGDVPASLRDLFQSGLADQIEQIKITPSYLSTEAMSNLWMAFSTPYRPTPSEARRRSERFRSCSARSCMLRPSASAPTTSAA